MGPAVVTCIECGARIRIAKPENALDRSCPRCSTPLITALGQVLEAEPARPSDEPRARPKRVWLGAAMALAVVVPPLSVGVRYAADRGTSSAPAPALASAASPAALPACPAPEPARHETSRVEEPAPQHLALNEKATPEADPGPEASDETRPRPDPAVFERSPLVPTTIQRPAAPSQPPSSSPGPGRTPTPPPPPDRAERTPEPPRPRSEPVAPTASSPGLADPESATRIRIRNRTGEVVVGRVHGHTPDGKTCVLLPDGQLGFTSGMAETDEPFRPATFERIRDDLTSSGPFAKFQVRQSAHYLVLYQSTPTFADASIKLLEDLYKNLGEAFRKRKIEIREPEFPLVAIIFRTERDFRAHKEIASDVQAYYEILSNRIYFYQKSERDQQSPEVAALRKPQTVAHEGTHQILQNIGIHPRLSDWPLWLVEGLAEYCSPPTMTKKGAAWGGLGLVNPMHMATIHDLDDPASLHVNGTGRPRLGRDRRTPLVEYLVTRSDLTPTDYALSWALTHYLAMKRGPEFLAFLRTMSQMPPLEKRTAADHLTAFRAAFGPDLARMDKSVATHLAKLKYDPLPYYAVMFEQPLGRGQIRRATMVSQSPSMIRQWLEEVSRPDGGPPAWEIHPHPTRSRAVMTTEQWMNTQ